MLEELENAEQYVRSVQNLRRTMEGQEETSVRAASTHLPSGTKHFSREGQV